MPLWEHRSVKNEVESLYGNEMFAFFFFSSRGERLADFVVVRR